MKDLRRSKILLDLPNELLFMVARYLDPQDLYPLVLANRRFHSLLASELHTFAIRDRYSMPALHYAAFSGNTKLVRYLLAKGFDVNYVNIQNHYRDSTWAPLYYGVKSSNLELVRLLLDGGASIDARNDMGNTAAHEAAYIVADLEEVMDIQDRKSLAFNRAHIRMNKLAAVLRLLVLRGANLSIHNYDHRTALNQYCNRRRHTADFRRNEQSATGGPRSRNWMLLKFGISAITDVE